MDALRWVLLLLGGIILIAIYLFGKRAESKKAAGMTLRDEPQFSEPSADQGTEETAAEDDWEIIPIPPRGTMDVPEAARAYSPPEDGEDTALQGPSKPVGKSEPVSARSHPEVTHAENASENHAAPTFEDVLIIHVVSTAEPLNGRDLAEAFDELGLSLDERGIYVRLDDHGMAPLFGVVNMVKPGIFTPDALAGLETPGISLFLTLPGPEVPMVAFREMKDCAKNLAARLHAHMEDETHSALSPQTLTHLEERVRQFIQHRAHLQGVRQ